MGFSGGGAAAGGGNETLLRQIQGEMRAALNPDTKAPPGEAISGRFWLGGGQQSWASSVAASSSSIHNVDSVRRIKSDVQLTWPARATWPYVHFWERPDSARRAIVYLEWSGSDPAFTINPYRNSGSPPAQHETKKSLPQAVNLADPNIDGLPLDLLNRQHVGITIRRDQDSILGIAGKVSQWGGEAPLFNRLLPRGYTAVNPKTLANDPERNQVLRMLDEDGQLVAASQLSANRGFALFCSLGTVATDATRTPTVLNGVITWLRA